MDWIELSITTNTEGADIVSEALMRAGAKGTQIIDRADVPDPSKPSGYWELIDPSLIEQMPEEVVVKAWFQDEKQLIGLREKIAQLPELAGFDLGALQLSQSGVAEKDWAEYWKRFYKPFRIGSHLVVRPSSLKATSAKRTKSQIAQPFIPVVSYKNPILYSPEKNLD